MGRTGLLLADLPPGAAASKPPVIAGFIPDLAGAIVVTTPSEVASDVVQKSVTYARDMGIKVLGIVENMSEYRCPSCGELNELFEGNTDAMCEALDLPLLGRIPFDRKLARTFDKGEPCWMRPIRPSSAIRTSPGGSGLYWITRECWRKNCELRGAVMKFVCLTCETYMNFEKVEARRRIARRLLRLSVVRCEVLDGDQSR